MDPAAAVRGVAHFMDPSAAVTSMQEASLEAMSVVRRQPGWKITVIFIMGVWSLIARQVIAL